MRFLVFTLGLISIPVSVSAMPASKSRVSPPSVAIRVQDWDTHPADRVQPSPQRLKPEDCRMRGLVYRQGSCVQLERKSPALEREPRASAAPRWTASPEREPATRRHAKETPSGAVAGQDRIFRPARTVVLSTSRVVDAEQRSEPRKPVGLRRMAGQLLLSGFAGKRPADADVERAARALRDGRLSGIFVSDANISSSRQLRQLLLSIGKDGGDTIPFIAIEQAGGPDSALSEEKGFTFYASPNAVTSEHNPYEAKLFYSGMALELSSLGVNLNMGPSADACREEGVDLSALCFGTSASDIAVFARAFSAGHHDRGVLTALRHASKRAAFLPSKPEPASKALLRSVMAVDFADALVIRVKTMERLPFGPQSASRLRRVSGFRGAIIFDLDLGVSGAPVRCREAIIKAFQTGADIVLIRNPSVLPADFASIGYDAVESGLDTGRLQMARIEDAYRRVLRLKDRLRGLQSKAAAHAESPSH